MLLGVKNGVIELDSGTFRPGEVEDFISRTANVNYDQYAECPRFEQFVKEILEDDKELIDYLQTLIGYLCMGHNPDHLLVIMQGRGNNGKSVLLNVIEALLGEYVNAIPLATMIKVRNETVGDDIMSLLGYRVLMARELPQDQTLNSAKLKQLTGNDSTSARHLHGKYELVRVKGTFIIATNEIPKITDVSDGIWRRMRLIPFRYVVPDSKKDPHMEEKLLEELPGILNWAMVGLKRYLADIFEEPQIMKQMKQDLRLERSPLEVFVYTHYEKCTPGQVSSQKLYQHYLQWAKTTANAPHYSHKKFSMDLVKLDIDKSRPKETIYGLKPKEKIGWSDPEV
jgi:putative DNA primase/helicase